MDTVDKIVFGMNVLEKMVEYRLRWFGHVWRSIEVSVSRVN